MFAGLWPASGLRSPAPCAAGVLTMLGQRVCSAPPTGPDSASESAGWVPFTAVAALRIARDEVDRENLQAAERLGVHAYSNVTGATGSVPRKGVHLPSAVLVDQMDLTPIPETRFDALAGQVVAMRRRSSAKARASSHDVRFMIWPRYFMITVCPLTVSAPTRRSPSR